MLWRPTSFAAAVQAQRDGGKDAARGRRRGQDARASAGRRSGACSARIAAAATARQSLDGVIKAREDALAAEAPKLAPRAWHEGRRALPRRPWPRTRAATPTNAQKRAAEAEVLLREAELIAIKGGILDEARALIAQADEAKVEQARRRAACRRRSGYLAEAEQEIQRNRYDVTLPRKLAAAGSLRGAACDSTSRSSSSACAGRRTTTRPASKR